MGDEAPLKTEEEKNIFQHNPWIWIGTFVVLMFIALGSFVYWVTTQGNQESNESQAIPPSTSTALPNATKSTSNSTSSTESINNLNTLISDLDNELTAINEDINSSDDEKVDL